MADRILSSIAQNPVFAGLSAAERSSLALQGTARRYIKGESIALHGDTWPYLMLIIEGEVDAIKVSSEGRELLVSTFGPGELFWGLAFFHEGAPMPVTLQARLPAWVLLWTRQTAVPVLMKNGAMGWELCRLMSRRMMRASAILEEMAFQPVAGRLAHFLLDLSADGDESSIARSLTLDEIAVRVGSTREVVCRFLQRFADQGWIDITRTEFTINDRPQLSMLAQQAKG